MKIVPQKRCTKCGKKYARTIENFLPDKRRKDKLSSECRECHNLYYYANPSRVKNNAQRWQRQHPDKRREIVQRYNRKNRDKRAVLQRRRESRKADLRATLTDIEWENIKAEYGFSCAYCGKAWFEIDGKLQQDHVVPVPQNGEYTADNIVPACGKCNSRKNGRTPEQAGMPLLPKKT